MKRLFTSDPTWPKLIQTHRADIIRSLLVVVFLAVVASLVWLALRDIEQQIRGKYREHSTNRYRDHT